MGGVNFFIKPLSCSLFDFLLLKPIGLVVLLAAPLNPTGEVSSLIVSDSGLVLLTTFSGA